MKVQNTLKNMALALSLLVGSANIPHAFGDEADSESEVKVKDTILKYSKENEKAREKQLLEMRDLRIKHLNDLYAKKIANNKSISAMWRGLKPGEKEANIALRAKIKLAQQNFHKEEEKLKNKFEKIVQAKSKSLQSATIKRNKEMKDTVKK